MQALTAYQIEMNYRQRKAAVAAHLAEQLGYVVNTAINTHPEHADSLAEDIEHAMPGCTELQSRLRAAIVAVIREAADKPNMTE